MNNYLIPANANRGKLLLGYFRPVDLTILGIGFLASFILLIAVDLTSTLIAALTIVPVGVAGILVFPIPHYHNVLVVLQEIFRFLNNRQKYIWKGWCYKNGEGNDK